MHKRPVSGFSSLTPTLWLLGFTVGFPLLVGLAGSIPGCLILWLVINVPLMRALSLQIMPLFSKWGLARPPGPNLATSAKGMLKEKCDCSRPFGGNALFRAGALGCP